MYNQLKSPSVHDDFTSLLHKFSVGGNIRTMGPIGRWPWDCYIGADANVSTSTLTRNMPSKFHPLNKYFYPDTYFKDQPLSLAQQQLEIADNEEFMKLANVNDDLSAKEFSARANVSLFSIMTLLNAFRVMDYTTYEPKLASHLEGAISYTRNWEDTIRLSEFGMNPRGPLHRRQFVFDSDGKFGPVGVNFSQNNDRYDGSTINIELKQTIRVGQLANMWGMADKGYWEDWNAATALPKLAWAPAAFIWRIPGLNVGLKDLLLLVDSGKAGDMPVYLGARFLYSKENYQVTDPNTLQPLSLEGNGRAFELNATIGDNLTLGYVRSWNDNGYNYSSNGNFYYAQWKLYPYNGEKK